MEGDIMPIKYDKLINLMHEKGITSYTIKRDKVIGQATYKKIIEGGDIDTRTIAKLCKLLNCQPGDILEYSEDDPAPESSEEAKEG
ncbi:MAG: helix-turn-helix domain-containing protein [Clostridia bacterium]|jgi:putative transcriptional regulator|nr:helix-turn-helix transcriptional regulator [Oscillospiraceae bacterium]